MDIAQPEHKTILTKYAGFKLNQANGSVIQLTNLGELVCFDHYASLIAADPKTHVIQLIDFQDDMASKINRQNLADSLKCDEINEESKSDRVRHTLVSRCKIE